MPNNNNKDMFNKIIGLGESSPVKSYYPELRKRLKELEKFRFMMDGINDFIAVFEFGPNGKLLDSNKAFREISCISRKDTNDNILSSIVTFNNGQTVNWDQNNANEHSTVTYTGVLHSRCYDELPVEFKLTPMNIDDQRYLVFIGRDIKERLEKENMLTKLNIMLEEKLEKVIQEKLKHQEMMIKQSRMAAMGEMIGNIAHQWRQPLNSLGLYIQDTVDAFHLNQLDKEYLEEFIDNSMNQINFMSKTIDNFRNYYKPNKAKVVLDVHKLIKETLSIIEKQLEANNIELRVIVEDKNNKLVSFGYANELKQVILNLIANAYDAVKHSIDNHSIDQGFIEVALYEKGKHIYIEVRDNGGGIHDKIINKIFEPYFTTKQEGEGVGIGLYMSKLIIENNMEGSLTGINSDYGITTFIIKMNKKI
ncbi:MAG: hypothetical protein C0603_02940 [Denitrovibrio sp.]|nr:MAG: hypothetical protein C0603_02940 [Denitrovibrio sp.]